MLGTLGRGGMSEVFTVYDVRSGSLAALKLLQHEAAAKPRAAERFALEGRVLQELRHRGGFYLMTTWHDPPMEPERRTFTIDRCLGLAALLSDGKVTELAAWRDLASDGAAVSDETALELTARSDAEVLVFDLA